MEASVYINRFVPPCLWDGMSASAASNVGQCSGQGVVPHSQLPPSWWEEQFLESFLPCLSVPCWLRAALLFSPASWGSPSRTSSNRPWIRLHIAGVCKVCLPFSNFPYRCLLCSLVSCFYSCFLWKFSGFYWWVIFVCYLSLNLAIMWW